MTASAAGKPSERRRLWELLIVLGMAGWIAVTLRDVATGGFYVDDWWIADRVDAAGLGHAIAGEQAELGNRPLLAVVLTVPYELFGQQEWAHHALDAVILGASAALFFCVLRQLRFARRDAAAMTTLFLLFPWTSAVRFWPTGVGNSIAVPLFFAGFLVALRGLRTAGPRGAAMHGVAAVLYAASILTYETATLVVAVAWTAYGWLHGWGRPTRSRALVDVGVVFVLVMYGVLATTRDVVALDDFAGSARNILVGGGKLIVAAFLPAIPPSVVPSAASVIPWMVLGGVAVMATYRRRPWSRAGRPDDPLSTPMATVVAAGAALTLSWAVYIPANAYVPDQPGLDNRPNVLAAYPLTVLVYVSVVSVCGRVRRNDRRLAAVAACGDRRRVSDAELARADAVGARVRPSAARPRSGT
jgi:hypothetical protein